MIDFFQERAHRLAKMRAKQTTFESQGFKFAKKCSRCGFHNCICQISLAEWINNDENTK